MAKKTNLLSARAIETLPTGNHSDGGNLYLRVKESGARSWVFRYKLVGKAIEVGLGGTDTRTLAQARAIAAKMRTAIADGQDPKELLAVKRDLKAMKFSDYAKDLIDTKRPEWRNAKHALQWTATLETYAYPSIGNKLPANITLADIKAILSPIWLTKTETATRLRQRIEAVLDNAAVHEKAHGRYNPARWKGNLDQVLSNSRKVKKREHHAAAPYSDVPRIMAALRNKDVLSAYCLRFIILTVARSGEARGALWSEIDLTANTWTIPSHRMKADRLHRVPLCDEAMQILRKMLEWRMDDAVRVFAGGRGGLLSDVAVNKMLHSTAPDIEATVHGFRTSFRVWGAENTPYPSAVLEAALAHVNTNQVEAAYQRSDLFDKRKELMQAWGDYCRAAPEIATD